MHGWIGTILRVNLTTGSVSREPLDPALARDYIGARGLGTKVLFDEVDPRVDPLAPENKLIFAATKACKSASGLAPKCEITSAAGLPTPGRPNPAGKPIPPGGIPLTSIHPLLFRPEVQGH